MSSLRAVRGVDRAIVQAVSARELAGEQKRPVVDAAHDVSPFALRLGPHAERGKTKHALHGGTRAECSQRLVVDRQRLADRHDRSSDRVGGEKPVEMRLGGQAAEQPDRVFLARLRLERARLPVAPRRLLGLAFRHRIDRASDIVPGQRAQRRAHAPLALGLVQRSIADFAIPGVGFGQQLPGCAVCDQQIAVAPIRLGQAGAPAQPGAMRRLGVGACDSVERVQRDLAAAAGAEPKLALGQRGPGISLDAIVVGGRWAIVGRKLAHEPRCKPEIARLVRKPKAAPDVVRRDLVSRLQLGKQRLARLGLVAAAEPVLARVGQCPFAIRFAAPLQGEAGELGIFAVALRIFGSELVPERTLAKRLQPFAAQACRPAVCRHCARETSARARALPRRA